MRPQAPNIVYESGGGETIQNPNLREWGCVVPKTSNSMLISLISLQFLIWSQKKLGGGDATLS